MSQRHPFFDVSESCKNTGIQENPTANLPQGADEKRNDTTAEQIAKEAAERRKATQNNATAKAVSPNLDEQGKGRTDEIMAKKAGVNVLCISADRT